MTDPKSQALLKEHPSLDDVLRRFRDFLSLKGLRFTREREELLAAIFQAPRHFEAVQKEMCQLFGYTLVDHLHEIFGVCRSCQKLESAADDPAA